MKTVETKLPAGDIVDMKKLPDGTWVIKQNVEEACNPEPLGKEFVFIDAENLGLDDAFMQYEPKTNNEAELKVLLTNVITKGVKNFYRPIMDPSFTHDGIAYVAGKVPAIGKDYNWWVDAAKKYNPSHNSRLGTRFEYVAFLGILLKKLVQEGNSVEWAWNAVCEDSKELGHYYDSENAKNDFEPTGSRLVSGFYDLANTFKFVTDDERTDRLWIVSGCYNDGGDEWPLGDIAYGATHDFGNNANCVGWLVLS